MWTPALLLLALAVSCFTPSAPAMAGTITGHVFESSFDGSDTPDGSLGTLVGSTSTPIAIDQKSGNVYVIDPTHNVVNVFDEAGSYRGQLDGLNTPNGSFTFDLGNESDDFGAVAIDNSGGPTQGRIYVVDKKGLNAFSPSRAYLWRAPGRELRGVAVDSDGNVWDAGCCSDAGTRTYSPAGTLLSESSLGGGTGLEGFAFDPSGEDIYARIQELNTGLAKFEAASGTQKDVVASAGLTPGNFLRGLAVDPSAGTVYIAGLPANSGFRNVVIAFDAAGKPVDQFGASLFTDDNIRGVAINSTTNRIYVADRHGQVDVFGPASVGTPDATLDVASEVTETSVRLNGTVNPQGHPTSWRFEYRLPGAGQWHSTPEESAGEGSEEVAVSAPISGLTYGTIYQLRLTATDTESDRIAVAVGGFATQGRAPVVETLSAAPRTMTTARLNARLDPNGAATRYYFEYGSNTEYGWNLPLSKDAEGGVAQGAELVSQQLGGLSPATTYHYRVIAENEHGKDEGDDMTFVTRSIAEMALPQRGIELVNTPDKGNQNIGDFAKKVSADGNRALWSVASGAPGATTGGRNPFLAERSPSGWQSRPVVPPAAEQYGGGELQYALQFAGADLSHFLFTTTETVFGASPYATIRVNDHQEQQILREFPEPAGENELAHIGVNQSSPDLSHVVYWNGLNEKVFDAGEGIPTVVSLMQNDLAPKCGVPASPLENGYYQGGEYDYISDDASHVYFLSKGNSCGTPLKLYLRNRNTGTTTTVSGPPVAGSPEAPAIFIRTNASGTSALFASRSRLSGADENEDMDIYRFEEGAGSQCLTCAVAEDADVSSLSISGSGYQQGVLASADLSYVYFTSQKLLVKGAGVAGKINRYLLHDGAIQYIGTFEPLYGLNQVFASLSQGGQVLVFLAAGPEKGGGTTDQISNGCPGGPCTEVYRYDAGDASLECVSCRTTGTTSAEVPAIRMRLVSSDGKTIVFTTAEPLLSRDINGKPDIYEWHNGAIQLITDGATEFPPGPGSPSAYGISASGSDIMFTVASPLTGYERDGLSNLYDARVDGGFSPPTTPATCTEDACQGPLQAPPSLKGSASSGFSGQANQSPKAKKRHHKKRHHHKRKRAAHHNRGGAK